MKIIDEIETSKKNKTKQNETKKANKDRKEQEGAEAIVKE